MPLPSENEDDLNEVPVAPPTVIVSPEYKTTLVDTKHEPIASLLTHIAGSSWTVDYYQQLVGRDEELSPFQPTQPNVYQQYRQIQKFELKVTNPLNSDQDDQSTNFTAVGTAIIYPFVVPNKGDVFVANLGDGRLGLFNVERVIRKSILKQACHEIEYSLTQVMSSQIQEMLNQRIVQKTVFRLDFLTYGQYPLVVEEDVVAVERMTQMRYDLLSKWLQRFFSHETNTVLIPGQGQPTYDPFLTEAILMMFNTDDHPLLKKIIQYNCGGHTVMHQMNIWYAMMNATDKMSDVMVQRMWLLDTSSFSNFPLHQSVYFSRIKRVVYPYVYTDSVDNEYFSTDPRGFFRTDKACCCTGFAQSGSSYVATDGVVDLISIFQNNVLGEFEDDEETDEDDPSSEPSDEPPPLVHPVTVDDYYVFSQHFYEKSTFLQSVLEILVNDMLAGNQIDRAKLMDVYNDLSTRGRLEYFYYAPVLMILLNYAIRRM